MKVAILGFGTVGSGVYDIINKNNSAYLSDIEVVKILRHNKSQCTSDVMCVDFDEILHANVDLIIEALGGDEPAYHYICSALINGIHVVSANKLTIALHLQEYHQLANKAGVSFSYEASCGGGIPWIQSIKKAARIDTIQKISGIFNGTSNYILDHMEKDQVEFQDILKVAQKLGYAEKDPFDDISGYDCMRKLYIASSIAYERDLPSEIPVFGIDKIQACDIRLFSKWGLSIRLIATSILINNHYYAVVEPTLCDGASMESATHENNNLGCLYGDTIGELKFYGQGAGKYPTANAIIQDIIDILYPRSKPDKEIIQNKKLIKDPTLIEGVYYIRCKIDSRSKVLMDEIISEYMQIDNNVHIITKKITSHYMHMLAKSLKKIDEDLFFARFNEERKKDI